jgi:hypothetical protein
MNRTTPRRNNGAAHRSLLVRAIEPDRSVSLLRAEPYA